MSRAAHAMLGDDIVPLLRWSIYYGDFSRYDGESETDAFAAPVLPSKFGVQVLKQEANNERGFTLRHGCTFYCWETTPVGRWGGHDDVFGLAEYLLSHDGPQKILLGREIYDETYQAICRKAVEDGGWK